MSTMNLGSPSSTDVEFQVILLAGGIGAGHRLYPLTESEELPKCMLPVANRPLISYQLELLERGGFTEVMVITDDTAAQKIRNFMNEIYKGKIKVDIIVFKEELGTADVLFRIRDKIKSDFIVVSGDLIVDEGFLHHVADVHRKKNAAATILLKQRIDKTKVKKFEGLDFIGLDDEQRVVYFNAAENLSEELKLRKSLLRSFPNITVYRNLADAHFYIFSKWVLSFLEEKKESISSIKLELIPMLVHAQYSTKVSALPIQDPLREANGMSTSSARIPDTTKPGCYAYIMTSEHYCSRANTIPSYMEINNDVARGASCWTPWERRGRGNYVAETATIHPKAQVGAECVIGEGTTVGEHCSIKKSVVGKHCKIGTGVKILNSVVMDHVTIADGTVIDESEIGRAHV